MNSEEEWTHIFINFPRLGLLRKERDYTKVIKLAKKKIWKQLKHMSINKFQQYCNIEVRKYDENPTKMWWFPE